MSDSHPIPLAQIQIEYFLDAIYEDKIDERSLLVAFILSADYSTRKRIADMFEFLWDKEKK